MIRWTRNCAGISNDAGISNGAGISNDAGTWCRSIEIRNKYYVIRSRYIDISTIRIEARTDDIEKQSHIHRMNTKGDTMRVGEVCLLTGDVVRLADFYKELFHIENGSNDNAHQFIIAEETTLTIYNDGVCRESNPHNICIAFTVADVDAEYERLKQLGVDIVEPPTVRPWGAKNMSFLDPDQNLITFRSII